MKNQLIRLSECSGSPGHYQPALREHGEVVETLHGAMNYRSGSYTLRPDLDGLVHECGGLPIVELPYPEVLVAVRDSDADLYARWVAAISQ